MVSLYPLSAGSNLLASQKGLKVFQKLKLKKEAKFIVFHRAGYDIINKGLDIILVDEGNPSKLSSTKVREYTKQGKSIEGLVPREVAEYIKTNKLYLS